MLLSVTEESASEQATRPRSGHVGPSVAEDSGAWASSRSGYRPAADAGVARRAAGQRWVAVPGAAQARTGRLDQRRVEGKREQPPGQVLLADAVRPARPRPGNAGVEPPVDCHRPRAQARGGVSRASGTLVSYVAVAGSHAVSPSPGRSGTRRGIGVPRRTQDGNTCPGRSVSLAGA